jgi:hypothetical protein
MDPSNFQNLLERMSDQELVRYAREYTRRSVAESDDRSASAHWMLDLIYGECIGRRKEWLYDKAREAILRETAPAEASSAGVRRRSRRIEWLDSQAEEEEPEELYLETD